MKTTIQSAVRGLVGALIGVVLLAALPAAAKARSEPKGEPSATAVLVRGAGYDQPRGSGHVGRLQRRLHLAGESPGPIDGRFGRLTEAAVRRFQLRHGLAVDGIAGPKTQAALGRAASLLAIGAGYNEARGSARVRSLQRQLRRVEENPGPIDGRFGPRTEAAVVRFQRNERLAADGIVGPETRGALEQRPAKAESRVKSTKEPTRTPAGKPRPAARPSSGFGLSTEAVLAIVAGIAMLAGGFALALKRATGGRPTDARRGSRRAEPFPLALRRPSTEGPAGDGSRVLGYATVAPSGLRRGGPGLREQAEAVAAECKRRGLVLVELVRERESDHAKSVERPGLGYALSRISAGEATGLVVASLARLSRSVSDLGQVLEWFSRSDARLVAAAQGLDTAERDGRLAARTLIEVSGWERERLGERTRKGLEAARAKGRPTVADKPELRKRIARMRAEGMTLQAIADQLNAEGVPTVRGGDKWRPSSVQTAAGYRRPRPGMSGSAPPGPAGRADNDPGEG